jgi:predicted O-linked N-acetylglucosamine transferase (SPINDLY family)
MIAAPRSRNDPCPCGSGARYKHCHGAVGHASAGAPGAEALFHRANQLRLDGDARGAIAQYEAALALEPGHPAVLNNLGLALEALGEHRRAEACYRDALTRNPDYIDALGNLASVVFEREDHREASALYDRLVALTMDLPPPVWVRSGIAHQKCGASDQAEASFRQAAALAPDDVRIQANLATALIEQNRYAEAEPPLLRALALQPDHGYALSMLALSRMQRCAWDGLEALFQQLELLLDSEAQDETARINPFALLPMPLSARAQLNAARRWAAGLAPSGRSVPRPPWIHDGRERLRVGFVSSDWREQSGGRLLAARRVTIDSGRIVTFGYALLPPSTSAFGQRLVRAVDHFTDVSAAATADIAQTIRHDRIDVLVDLNGYTTHDRALLFALRPAPIQLHWLGYLGTLGASWIDYVLTDRIATPAAHQSHFSERLLYLPDSLFPGDRQREIAAAPPTRDECGLPPGMFVFCCFNNQFKILPPVFDIWMRLLRQTEASVLWLSPADDDAIDNLRREAARRHVDPDRLVFAPRVSSAMHLARHCHADLFLDTTPYNAGVTANDALWMGVPVVTCTGETMASRTAASQLHAIGLSDVVTGNVADYEGLALRLARDPNALREVRHRLAGNRHSEPLFDTPRFARHFEDALLRVAADAAQMVD